RNTSSAPFTKITAAAGLTRSPDMSGGSNGIFDFDNDGWKDLLAVRATVQDKLALLSTRRSGEPITVFRNLGNGKFADIAADAGPDLRKPAAHRGVAVGDLDNDGRVDAVV